MGIAKTRDRVQDHSTSVRENRSLGQSAPQPETECDTREVILQVSGLCKSFARNATGISGVSFSIRKGEIVSILGPSGCGKTTTLRIIAGLEHPDSGEVHVRGVPVLDVPPFRRDVGLMFQNLALFPNKTIAGNIAFGLRMIGLKRHHIRERVNEILELVELPGAEFANRYPSQLSGGQRQRVALARTLVTNPSVVMFDEPLASLDRRLRDRMALELRALQLRLGVTSVYVTHDQETASMMSDRLIIMEHGEIAQVGTPHEIYSRPDTRFVGDFMGDMNFLAARIETVSDDVIRAVVCGKSIDIPHDKYELSGQFQIGVRPEHIQLFTSCTNSVLSTAIVSEAYFTSGVFTYRLVLEDDTSILARTMSRARIKEGDHVWIEIDPQHMQLLPLV